MGDRVVSNGELTVVDLSLAGRPRLIGVTREAIEDHLKLTPEEASQMSADDRCAFVRANIGLIADVALRKLEAGRGLGEALVIRTADFAGVE